MEFGDQKLCTLDSTCRWRFDVDNSRQMNIPTSVDQVLDGYVVQTLAKIDAVHTASN